MLPLRNRRSGKRMGHTAMIYSFPVFRPNPRTSLAISGETDAPLTRPASREMVGFSSISAGRNVGKQQGTSMWHLPALRIYAGSSSWLV